MTTLSDTTPVARKSHQCNACDCLLGAGWNGMGFSFSEFRAIAKAKRNRWQIQKGQQYIYRVGVYDGEFCTFKAISEINAICEKHGLYYE